MTERLLGSIRRRRWFGRRIVERRGAASLPLVSCVCPTYGRPPDHQHLVEEAIASFVKQTYPNKELIVLNDCPGQTLVCNAPGVRVVNVPERFPTLGDKRNAGVGLSRGQLIAPWDDDDISLPWRLSVSVARLGDAGYFNPRRYWFWCNGVFHLDQSTGVGHNLSLFTRDAFETVGGYPALSVGEDLEIDNALRARVACAGDPSTGQEELPRNEWYYIYRWGVSPMHVSSRTGPEQGYREIGARPVREGRFRLRSRWRMDYDAETRRLLDAAAGDPRPAAEPRPAATRNG